jgi:hypothetical protein
VGTRGNSDPPGDRVPVPGRVHCRGVRNRGVRCRRWRSRRAAARDLGIARWIAVRGGPAIHRVSAFSSGVRGVGCSGVVVSAVVASVASVASVVAVRSGWRRAPGLRASRVPRLSCGSVRACGGAAGGVVPSRAGPGGVRPRPRPRRRPRPRVRVTGRRHGRRFAAPGDALHGAGSSASGRRDSHHRDDGTHGDPATRRTAAGWTETIRPQPCRWECSGHDEHGPEPTPTTPPADPQAATPWDNRRASPPSPYTTTVDATVPVPVAAGWVRSAAFPSGRRVLCMALPALCGAPRCVRRRADRSDAPGGLARARCWYRSGRRGHCR